MEKKVRKDLGKCLETCNEDHYHEQMDSQWNLLLGNLRSSEEDPSLSESDSMRENDKSTKEVKDAGTEKAMRSKFHLTRLVIENFKGWKKSEANIKEGITVLGGENNSGKSSMLQALSLWHFCIWRLFWDGKSLTAKTENEQKRSGTVLSRQLLPLDIPDMKNLWRGNVTVVAYGSKETIKNNVLLEGEGRGRKRASPSCGFQLLEY